MLELRPNCEFCDRDLPPDAPDAMICSYECTYCADCVENELHNVCPTCGGGFERRPIRPQRAWRPELKLGLANQPAGSKRRALKFPIDDVRAHVARIKDIPPNER